MKFRATPSAFVASLVGFLLALSMAADDKAAGKAQDKPQKAAVDKTAPKPLSEKEQKRRQKSLEKELNRPFERWLNEDVAYIIMDEERQAFKRLQNAEERDQFIEQFWLRRDPTPDTIENEMKEEHYRRIAYANEHYASGIPGW